METSILSALTHAELESIPESIKFKLEERWNTSCEALSNMKTDFEKVKTDSEQIKFSLEQELAKLKECIGKELKLKSQNEKRAKDAEEKASDLEREVQSLSAKNSTLICQLQITRSENESVGKNSTALSANLEVKNRIIEDLKIQIASLEEELSSATKAKADAQIQSEEARSLQNQLNFKEAQLSRERSLLRGQVELLQEQLEKRVHEALELRNEHSYAVLQQQHELHQANAQLSLLKETNEALTKTVEEKSKRVEELLEALKDMRENELKLEESFRMELTAQQKLVSIHETSCEDLKAECSELEKAVTELRASLQEAGQHYAALERSKEQQAKLADEEMQQREELIKDLRDELNKVNMLLEANAKRDERNALYELTPAASAASELMSKGLTLSQLYAEYLTATDKLNKLEAENERLTRYIDQILQEIEERTPVLVQQREEYLSATKTVSALQLQLDDNSTAMRRLKEETAELERRCKYLLREQESLAAENSDLSRQVTVLLTQVEAARAGLPPPALSVSSDSIRTGNDVVTAELVCFRDVSELQQQNQKLLHTVRDLTQQAELAEKAAIDKHVQGIQAELMEAKAELEELRVGRDRIEALVENISRQRDTYRSLLSQQNNLRKVPSNDDSESGSISPDAETSAAQQLKTECTRLEKELAAAKKELNTMQDDLKHARRKLEEQQREASKHLSDVRASQEKTREQNVKLLSHAEYNEERLKTLQSNCETLQRQLKAVEEKSTSLQQIVSSHEATIDIIRDENKTLNTKLAQAEVVARNLKEQNIIAKASEERLMDEREKTSRLQTQFTLMHTTLESIKNSIEHRDSGDRIRLVNEVADLTDQNTRLKAKLEANTDLKEANIKINALEERLQSSEREATVLTENLKLAQEQLTKLQERYDDTLAREKLLTLQLRDNEPGEPAAEGAGDAAGLRDLEVQLVEEKGLVSKLEASLKSTKDILESLQATCTKQEQELKHSADANRSTLMQLEELMTSKLSVERRLGELETKLKHEQEMAQSRIDQLTRELQQTREDVDSSREVVENAKSEVESAKKTELESKQLIESAQKEALEAQQKYEHEVMLHGTDLQALAKLKEQVATHSQQLEDITAQKLRAEATLKEIRSAGSELQETLKRERDSLKERVTDLEEHNKCLLDQFTQLSDKMAAIQNKLTQPQDGNESFGNMSFSEEEARSSEQLREVLRYLRRERELATSRCDVAQAETGRLRAQYESMQKRVQQLTQELAVERENKQVSLDTASRYGELLRKVHTVDALADSNRLLRQEKDCLQLRADEAKRKADALQEQVEPLNLKLAEALAETETVKIEKAAVENDLDMYKKRTQELVEKLNRAKPEDFQRLQQELATAKNNCQIKDNDNNRMRLQIQQIQKNLQSVVQNRQSMQQKVTEVSEEKNKLTEELKKVSGEKSRLIAQVAQMKEHNTALQSRHQQLEVKQLEQRNKLLQEVSDLKVREENARQETDNLRADIEMQQRQAEEKLQESEVRYADLNKQVNQIRRIAQKYKKAAEEEASQSRVKELENEVASLRQQLLNIDEGRGQEDATRTKLMEAEVTRLRQELEGRSKEVAALRATLNKQLTHVTVRSEDSTAKELTSKPSTSSASGIEKSPSDAPPTANIKPLAAAAPSVTMSSPRSTAAPVPPSSRTIPTASIRPLAPPAAQTSGAAAAQPRDPHSEGLVSSSTVILPQATVTPTPATPSATLPTTAANSTTAQALSIAATHVSGASAVNTLTATVPPTPASALSTSVATGHGSSIPKPSTAVQSLVVAQQPGPSTSGAPAAAGASSLQGLEVLVEDSSAGPSGISGVDASLLAISSDQLISQAMAMIIPGHDTPQPQASSVSDTTSIAVVGKRKRSDDEDQDEEEGKRCRVEQASDTEGIVSQEESASSSSQQADEQSSGCQHQDVILVDSDDEAGDAESAEHQMEESEAEERLNQPGELVVEREEADAPSESHEAMHFVQQPSSSSAGHRQAALIMPRPSANNDRVGSSGSTDGSRAVQPQLCDDNGSSMASFVSRTSEGFSEPVSSPQRSTAPPAGSRSPTGDASSETGVSTSDTSSNSAVAADSGAAQQQPQSGVAAAGHYPEADSVAAEVEEGAEDEEVDEEEDVDEEEQADEEVEDEHADDEEDDDEDHEENAPDDDDDDVVEVCDDDSQSREAQQQSHPGPGEAAQHRGGHDEGAVRVGSSSNLSYAAPSSSTAAPASPSSSTTRRITPITWDSSSSSSSSGQPMQPHAVRGSQSRGPYRSSDRILGRRQQLLQQQEQQAAPVVRGQSMRGVARNQKARRSRGSL